MYDMKNMFASKTVWGGIIALLAGIAALFGFDFGVEDQAKLVEIAIGVASAVGGLIAIYGRVVAKKKIGSG